LIHVGKDGRALFHIEYDNVHGPGKRHAYDLVINYSFYHKNSTMILTPYGGQVNYINHASDGRTPNVQVRFPNKELVAHKPEWLHKDPEFFHNAVEKIGLSFEYVALRDIAEGEEVLMDYGPEWEAAWQQHVAEWTPLEGAEEYQHSSDYEWEYLKTRAELEDEPYPPNLQTMCIASYKLSEDKDDTYVFVPLLKETTYRWYCHVVDRQEVVTTSDDGEDTKNYTYTVELYITTVTESEDEEEEPAQEEGGEWITIEGYTPDAISLHDKAFSTDWHLPNAFRHPIAIPDSVMPSAWQNGPDPYRLPEDDEEGEYLEYEEEEEDDDTATS